MEDLIVTQSSVIVSTPNGMYVSRDSGGRWKQLESPGAESELPVVRSIGGGEQLLAASPTEGLYVAALAPLAAPASASSAAQDSAPQK
jgi:hypothetical protein